MLLACAPQTEPAPSAVEPVDVDTAPGTTEDDPGTETVADRPKPARLAADDPLWQYAGRIDWAEPLAPSFIWSGSAVRGQIDATTLTLHLEALGDNWVNVVIDEGEPTVLQLKEGLQDYVVATALEPGPHALRVSKRTEAGDGGFRFHGVTADGALQPVDAPAWGIELYGDSITVSYSIECDCDEDLPEYKNFDLSYGALTAEALGAEVRAVAVSGIGVVSSWWPETMFDYWDSLQPGDAAWDFVWQPEVVVVNLGQNDYWLGVRQQIGPGYLDLHDELRAVYPDADIIFALGSMDAVAAGSPMPAFLEGAVTAMTNAGDTKVHALVFDYNGHGRHPVAADHQIMADVLTAKILEIRPDLKP